MMPISSIRPSPPTAAVSAVAIPTSTDAAPLDTAALGSPPPPTIDLRKAAQLVLSRQQGQVERAWTTSGTVSGSPVRGPKGEIFVSRQHVKEGRRVESLDPEDGHAIWSVTLPGGGYSTTPIVTPDGRLLVGGQDGQVHCLDLSSGAVQWSAAVPGGLGAPFLGADGLVYFAAGGNLSGFDPARRAVVTETPLRQSFESPPRVGKDGTVYGGGHDGDLYALTPGSGEIKWHAPTGGMLRNSPAIAADGTIYAGCIGKALVAFDPADGREKWRFPSPHWLLPDPVVARDGTVLAGCSDGKLYGVDPTTGKERWHFEMNGEARVSPVASPDGVIYAVSDRNRLYGLNERTGAEIWHLEAPSYVHCSPAPDGHGGIVFGSNDNTTVAVRDTATQARVRLEETVADNPSEPAPAPTVDREDGWVIINHVRVPVRRD